jgi:hypothetical protein
MNIPHPMRTSCSPSQLPEAPFDQIPMIPPVSIKIADLGNATPSKRHYTEDIQTRQYRAPEAIVGRRDWDARADIWSVACVVRRSFLFAPISPCELLVIPVSSG